MDSGLPVSGVRERGDREAGDDPGDGAEEYGRDRRAGREARDSERDLNARDEAQGERNRQERREVG